MSVVTSFIANDSLYRLMPGIQQVMKKILDFGTTAAADGATIQAMKVENGMLLGRVYCRLMTPEGGTTSCTMDVGDGDDPNGYLSAVSLTAATDTVVSSSFTSDAYAANGRWYLADDTIDVIIKGATGTAKVEIVAPFARIDTNDQSTY